MTGPEHYREAEKAIQASTWQRQAWGETGGSEAENAYRAYMWEMQRAQTHATLALAAATALRSIGRELEGWQRTAGTTQAVPA